MNRFYVYAFLREDGSPYYIGKGCDRRINSSEGRDFELPPKDRRVKIKENLEQKEAFDLERELISKYGRKGLDEGGILLNKSRGGDGPSKYETVEEAKQAEQERSRRAYYKLVSTEEGRARKSLWDKAYRERDPEKYKKISKASYYRNRERTLERQRAKRATPEGKAKKAASDKAYQEKVKKDPDRLKHNRERKRKWAEEKRRELGVLTKDEMSTPFKVVSPDGKIYEGRNCQKFAEEHGLHSSHFTALVHGKQYQCKGWTKFGWKPPENLKWNGKQWHPKRVKNKNSYEFEVVDPNGKIHKGFNQRAFAEEHNICYKALNKILKNPKKSHKGWRKHEKEIAT
tara:strand:+ start:43 stop:1071 length:1029 start_codon:yes stop_codon:yes gene_type:complete